MYKASHPSTNLVQHWTQVETTSHEYYL